MVLSVWRVILAVCLPDVMPPVYRLGGWVAQQCGAQGLGKTVIGLVAARALHETLLTRTIVLCPASLKASNTIAVPLLLTAAASSVTHLCSVGATNSHTVICTISHTAICTTNLTAICADYCCSGQLGTRG